MQVLQGQGAFCPFPGPLGSGGLSREPEVTQGQGALTARFCPLPGPGEPGTPEQPRFLELPYLPPFWSTKKALLQRRGSARNGETRFVQMSWGRRFLQGSPEKRALLFLAWLPLQSLAVNFFFCANFGR